MSLLSIPKATQEQINTERCDLLGDWYGYMIQFLLAILAFSTLLYKWHKETPRRPFAVWMKDISKQGWGSLLIHGLNMLVADALATNSQNPCVYYLMNTLAHVCFSMALAFALVQLMHRVASDFDHHSYYLFDPETQQLVPISFAASQAGGASRKAHRKSRKHSGAGAGGGKHGKRLKYQAGFYDQSEDETHMLPDPRIPENKEMEELEEKEQRGSKGLLNKLPLSHVVVALRHLGLAPMTSGPLPVTQFDDGVHSPPSALLQTPFALGNRSGGTHVAPARLNVPDRDVDSEAGETSQVSSSRYFYHYYSLAHQAYFEFVPGSWGGGGEQSERSMYFLSGRGLLGDATPSLAFDGTESQDAEDGRSKSRGFWDNLARFGTNLTSPPPPQPVVPLPMKEIPPGLMAELSPRYERPPGPVVVHRCVPFLRSGNYGSPEVYSVYMTQLLLWLLICLVVSLFVLFVIVEPFREGLYDVGEWLLSPIHSYPRIELAIVMIFIPLFVNLVYFWVQDNFLRYTRFSQATARKKAGEKRSKRLKYPPQNATIAPSFQPDDSHLQIPSEEEDFSSFQHSPRSSLPKYGFTPMRSADIV